MLAKLESLSERLDEVRSLLADPDVIRDMYRFRELSREYAELDPVVVCFDRYREALENARSARRLMDDGDPAIRELAGEEVTRAEQEADALEVDLKRLLIPRDPADEGNIFLEIRAGTGGDEACLFAGDLLRMYSRYAEQQGWSMEVLSEHQGEHGGYKEIITRVVGRGAYARLKFESGGHRVQRVPETESQGRIHTSACTVAVLPETDEVEEVDINPGDLKVDTYRASGAGGQHVNKTDSRQRAGQHAQASGGQRRPLAADPHLQLSPGPHQRPSHQPHHLQAGRGHGRRPGPDHRAPARRGSGRAARGDG